MPRNPSPTTRTRTPPKVAPEVAGGIAIDTRRLQRRLGKTTWTVWLAFIHARDTDGITRLRNTTICETRGLTHRQVHNACIRLRRAGMLSTVGYRLTSDKARKKILHRKVSGDFRRGQVHITTRSLYALEEMRGHNEHNKPEVLTKRVGEPNTPSTPAEQGTCGGVRCTAIAKSDVPRSEVRCTLVYPQDVPRFDQECTATPCDQERFEIEEAPCNRFMCKRVFCERSIVTSVTIDLPKKTRAAARLGFSFGIEEEDRGSDPMTPPTPQKTPPTQLTANPFDPDAPMPRGFSAPRAELARYPETSPAHLAGYTEPNVLALLSNHARRLPPLTHAERERVSLLLAEGGPLWPRYPTAKYMGAKLIPRPVPIPKEFDEQRAMQWASRMYSGAMAHYYPKLPRPLTGVRLEDTRYYAGVSKGVALLREYEVPLGGWIKFSIDAWRSNPTVSDRQKAKHPPINWVYQESRIERQLGWFERDEKQYVTTSASTPEELRVVAKRWSAAQRDRRRALLIAFHRHGGFSIEVVHQTVSALLAYWFPGGWQAWYDYAREGCARRNKVVQRALEEGEWVW